jgi:glycine hydroxymethyltransferase
MKCSDIKDKEVSDILQRELTRQQNKLIMIASENYVSPEVLRVQGSILTNKYAEGYPGKRYYHGCENADAIENLAVERAKTLFGAEHVNVQPHSGCQANMAVYYALLEMGDGILAMDLSHGGHLTHGTSINFSGKWYKSHFYGVDKKSETINMRDVRKLVLEHQPKIIVAGASAYPRKIDFAAFREIADEVNAYLLADASHITGLIAAGLHPDPVPFADAVTTTTHKTLRGPRSAMIMCRAKHASAINKAVFPGVQSGPFMHTIAAKAAAFGEAMKEDFKTYQKQVVKNAAHLAEALKGEGFRIVSGGTDNHLLLIDLKENGISGKAAADALDEAGITCNMNSVPFDDSPPAVTRGIRLGTPAVTTRGMKEEEMDIAAGLISAVLKNPKDDSLKKKTREEVLCLCKNFPVYSEL